VLDEFALPGAVFRPVRFRPTFDKWQSESCGGVYLHITDPHAFRSYCTTLTILAAVKTLWPREFAWRPPPYEYETVKMPIDILTGSAKTREWIDSLRKVSSPPEELCSNTEAARWLNEVRGPLDARAPSSE